MADEAKIKIILDTADAERKADELERKRPDPRRQAAARKESEEADRSRKQDEARLGVRFGIPHSGKSGGAPVMSAIGIADMAIMLAPIVSKFVLGVLAESLPAGIAERV